MFCIHQENRANEMVDDHGKEGTNNKTHQTNNRFSLTMNKLSNNRVLGCAAILLWLCVEDMLLPTQAFAPFSTRVPRTANVVVDREGPKLSLFDPSMAMDAATSMMDGATMAADGLNQFLSGSTSNLLAFTDQGSNLAGTFFQASLLPYLLFLYFLSFRANRLSALGNFGFQFVLVFVLSTIPSGIITKLQYGQSLADTDWLHGGAELLLTIANVLIVSHLMSLCSPTLFASNSTSNNIFYVLVSFRSLVCAIV